MRLRPSYQVAVPPLYLMAALMFGWSMAPLPDDVWARIWLATVLASLAAVYLPTTAWLARRSDPRWMPTTMLNAAVAHAVSGLLICAIILLAPDPSRLSSGEGLQFEIPSVAPSTGELVVNGLGAVLAAAALAALLSIPVGALARAVAAPSRPERKRAGGADPDSWSTTRWESDVALSEHAAKHRTLPERIEHPAFVLRCRDQADAPLVKEAVDENLEHLRRFMPWAWNEPEPVEQKAARLRDAREKFLRGEDWQFGIFAADETRLLGAIGLHPGAAPGTLEIGYWLREDAMGRGIATEATRILTRLAFTVLGASRVEIRCDAANERSGAVPRRLGFVLEATRDEVYEGRPRLGQTWARTRPP
jgi:RimJ/RimL family protein N-acetyltransferase